MAGQHRLGSSVARLVLVGAALLAGMVLTAGPASAHTELVSSDPAQGEVVDRSPEQVRLTFNEPIRLVDDSVQFFDATGSELESSAHSSDTTVQIEVPAQLAQGSYVVSWRVISADGHPVSGALTFSVGEPSDVVVRPGERSAEDAGPVLSALQGLTYLALFVSAGLALFYFLVLRGTDVELHSRLLPVAGPAAVLAGVGALLQIPATALYQQGLGISSAFDVGRWSDAMGREQVVASVLVFAGVFIGAEGLRRSDPLASLGGYFLAPVGMVLVGHTTTFGPTWLVALSDLLHQVAGATWMGGLVGLVLTLRHVSATRGAEILARFSALAAMLVAVVAVTGSLMAWRILRSWGALVDSPFGRMLIIKVAIVLVVLVVASANRFWLLQRFVAGSGDADLLRRTVRLEAVGLAAVLVLTGFLVERSPTKDAPDIVNSAVGVTGNVHLHVVLDPGRVGNNELALELDDPDGQPFAAKNDPVVTVLQPNLSLGDLAVSAQGNGVYSGSVVIPRSGEWTVRVSLRLSKFENPVVDLPVVIGEAP